MYAASVECIHCPPLNYKISYMNFLGPGAAAWPQATHKLQVCPVRLPLQPQPQDLPQLLTFGAAGCQKTSRLLTGFLSGVNQIKIKYQFKEDVQRNSLTPFPLPPPYAHQNSYRPSFSRPVSRPQFPLSSECNVLAGEQIFLAVRSSSILPSQGSLSPRMS